MRIQLPKTTVAVSVTLTALLALGGCNAVQPKPSCKAQSSDYAAKYKLVSKSKPDCAEVNAEVLHVQYYRTKPDAPNSLPSIAIEPASVADSLGAAHHAAEKDPAVNVDVMMGSEFSLAKYTTADPDDNDICSAPKFSQVTDITVAAIPEDKMACPAEDAIEPTKLAYKWSNLKMMVNPGSNAVYFGADLERTEGDCVVTYKVTGVNPAVGCGDAKGESWTQNEMTMMCEKDAEPDVDCTKVFPDDPDGHCDPFGGKPVQGRCEPKTQGTGLNQDLTYTCDADADGNGSHLCLPDQEFPALIKK
jgi:hypothetical protein